MGGGYKNYNFIIKSLYVSTKTTLLAECTESRLYIKLSFVHL